MPSAHIQIVAWNSGEDLPRCVASCQTQTMSVPVVIVDNASGDGSVDAVRGPYPDVQIARNRENRGYAGGHNDGLRAIADTEIAILLNPDVVLSSTFVEQILKPFSDPTVGAVAPLLLRSNSAQGTRNSEPVIDAYGTVLLSSLRAVNHLERQPVSSLQFLVSSRLQPWGFTGAAVALRRAALDDVAIQGEIFDEDLFAYREDVDLSWRLKHRGWKIVGENAARATHVRAARAGATKSLAVAQRSWRNYFLVLVKSVPARTLALHGLPIILESVARCAQLVVTPPLWPAAGACVRLFPRFISKRQRVFSSLCAAEGRQH